MSQEQKKLPEAMIPLSHTSEWSLITDG